MTHPTRRTVLTAGVLGGTAVVAGAAVGWPHLPWQVRRRLGLLTPDPYIPDAPEGRVTLETVPSAARGRDVGQTLAAFAFLGQHLAGGRQPVDGAVRGSMSHLFVR